MRTQSALAQNILTEFSVPLFREAELLQHVVDGRRHTFTALALPLGGARRETSDVHRTPFSRSLHFGLSVQIIRIFSLFANPKRGCA